MTPQQNSPKLSPLRLTKLRWILKTRMSSRTLNNASTTDDKVAVQSVREDRAILPMMTITRPIPFETAVYDGAVPKPRKFRTRYQAVSFQGPTARQDAETSEKNKWLDVFADLLLASSTPMGALLRRRTKSRTRRHTCTGGVIASTTLRAVSERRDQTCACRLRICGGTG